MKKSYFLKAGLMLVLAAVFAVQSVVAQNFRVSGNVVDGSGLALPGVTVLAQGTTIGVVTGLNGEYTITVPSDATLEFSFVGYNSVVVPVAGQSTINATLTEDVMSLDEVVVVGYGVQKRSHLTGSVATVSTEGMSDVPVSSLDQALNGRSAGLSVANVTGEAGEASAITIRGMGSISASSEPLVVVDGYPMEGGLSMVNTADVESIEILKDAASAAIYGSRAAGGVILVTTKSGVSDAPTYNLKVTSGVKFIYKGYDYYTTEEYYNKQLNEKAIYDVWAANNGYEAMDLEGIMTDNMWGQMFGTNSWTDAGLNEAANITTIQGSVSGGTDKVKYYVSGNYTYDEGSMVSNSYNKVSLRAKVDVALSDHVDFGISIAPSYSKKETPGTGYQNYIRKWDWQPIYLTQDMVDYLNAYGDGAAGEAGDYAVTADFANVHFWDEDGNEYVQTMVSGSDNPPVKTMDLTSDFTHTYNLNANVYLNISITDDLYFRTSNGVYLNFYNRDLFREADCLRPGDPAEAEFTNYLYTNLLSENMFTYMKTVGKHDFNVLAGYTADLTKERTANIAGTFDGSYVTTLNAASALTSEDTYTLSETTAMESYLARLTYSFDNKYLFSASYRSDGSSKFGPDDRYGAFPSVSLGWRMSEESFMSGATWIDQLKLRASYGITGNDAITNYAAYNTLGTTSYQTGTGIVAGYASASSTLGNESISWEQTSEINIGADFSVLGGGLNFVLDYYRKDTESLLLEESISSITGYSTVWSNLGQVRNRGFEFSVNSVNINTADFRWQTAFNIAFNKNIVIDLGGVDVMYSYGERSEVYRAKVGEEAIQFFSYKTDGIYLTQEEIDACDGDESTSNKKAGGLRLVTNGDGSLDHGDRYVAGTPFADFTWGLTNTFVYKDFDFSMTWQGSQGNSMVNGDFNYGDVRNRLKSEADDRWFCEDPAGWGDGVTPNSSSSGTNWMLTDYVVEDASYASLRDLTIGYTFPKHITSKLGLKGLRVYASGQNMLFIFTKDFRLLNVEAYNNAADEITTLYDNVLIAGYSRGNFPMQSTYSLGIDLSF